MTNNLGYPRIGSDRELKANEQYWSGKISADNLLAIGKTFGRKLDASI
jgi:hypothetical protein